jgi:hypothetical protein
MKVVNRKRIATLSLMIAMFFLPLGYDVAFFMLQKLIDSYVVTTLFFYLVSALFFGLYIFFSGIKLKSLIKGVLVNFTKKIRKIIRL